MFVLVLVFVLVFVLDPSRPAFYQTPSPASSLFVLTPAPILVIIYSLRIV